MKRRIKLSESDLNRIVKRAINEISYGLADNAYNKSDEVFTEMEYAFNDFYDTVKYNEDINNPYVKKIKEYAEKIASLLDRKNAQRNNISNELNKFDYKKFYGDKNRSEDEEDYNNLDLRMLQDRYPR